MPLQFLQDDHLFNMRKAYREMHGMLTVAASISDKAMSGRVVAKIQKAIDAMRERYSETENDDGSTLVKHPGIGFLSVEEKLCEDPVRLFASKVKSLSTNRIRLYRADALVQADGNVSYINRVLLVDLEMSQAAFTSLLANPGRGDYAATIREFDGVAVSYDGDLNHIRSKLMFDETQNATEGMAKWATKLVEQANAAAEKGGALSKTTRDEIAHNARVLNDWTYGNPGHYANMLAEFTDKTANDMKMEVLAAIKIKGNK